MPIFFPVQNQSTLTRQHSVHQHIFAFWWNIQQQWLCKIEQVPLDTLTRLGHVSRCYVDIVACQVSCLYIATKSTIYFVKELVYDIDKNQLEQPGLQVNNYRARMVVEKIVVREKTSLLKYYRIYPLHSGSVLWRQLWSHFQVIALLVIWTTWWPSMLCLLSSWVRLRMEWRMAITSRIKSGLSNASSGCTMWYMDVSYSLNLPIDSVRRLTPMVRQNLKRPLRD